MILVSMSCRFSLLALLMRMDEKMSTGWSLANTSTPFMMIFSDFSKNSRVILPYSRYFLWTVLSLPIWKVKTLSSYFCIPKGMTVSILLSESSCSIENFDLFLVLMGKLFLMIMHSHLMLKVWRSAVFI